MVTKERLKPFLDEGFVHNDRQKKLGEIGHDIKSTDSRTMEKINAAKNAIERSIEQVNVHEI